MTTTGINNGSTTPDATPQTPARVPGLCVGRDVHFHTRDTYYHLTARFGSVTPEEALASPLAAKVTKVVNAETGLVNLCVFSADGSWDAEEEVAMSGAGEPRDRTWRWMPRVP